jgi:hypothetical protein
MSISVGMTQTVHTPLVGGENILQVKAYFLQFYTFFSWGGRDNFAILKLTVLKFYTFSHV